MKRNHFLKIGLTSQLLNFTSFNTLASSSMRETTNEDKSDYFTRFLNSSKEARQNFAENYLNQKELSADKIRSTCDSFRKVVENFFLKDALAGDASAQFHLGQCITYIEALAKKSTQESAKWMALAAKQNHPGGLHGQITEMPHDTNYETFKSAIRSGSVSALGDMCGRCGEEGRFINGRKRSWLINEDDLPGIPFSSGFSNIEEGLLHWMIIYYYLLRIDPQRKSLKLSMPHKLTLAEAADPEFTGTQDIQRVTNILEKSADMAGNIVTRYPLEEIYDKSWDKAVFGW
jgi:TPR repeat protein